MMRKLFPIVCVLCLLTIAASAQTVTVVTDYEYDPFNMEPSTITVVSSDGSKRHTELEYGSPRSMFEISAVVVREEPFGPALSCSRISYFQSGPYVRLPRYVYSGCGSEEVQAGQFTNYDEDTRPTRIRLESGLWMDITYDGLNITNIIQRFIPGGASSETLLAQTFTYDNRGRLHTATDENGTQHRYDYDGLGRLKRVERKAPTELV